MLAPIVDANLPDVRYAKVTKVFFGLANKFEWNRLKDIHPSR